MFRFRNMLLIFYCRFLNADKSIVNRIRVSEMTLHPSKLAGFVDPRKQNQESLSSNLSHQERKRAAWSEAFQ